MLSGRGPYDELITRPEESYRLCCVVVCDLETSRMGAPYIYDISRLRVNRPNLDASCFNLVNVSIVTCLVLPIIIISAYAEIWFSLVDILPLASTFDIMTSITMLNSSADSGSPFLLLM